MMGSIQYWQLATDAFLVASLFYLALRFTRSSAGQLELRSQELQSGLRTLIREADKAGQVLNETLLRRQTELESLLNNLQMTESKIGRADADSEKTRTALTERIEVAKKMIQSLEDALNLADSRYNLQDQRTARSKVSAAIESPLETITQSVQSNVHSYAPEPPSFREAREKSSSETTKAVHTEEAPVAVNIYGEPIGQAAQANRSSRLEKAIEREATPSPSKMTSGTAAPIETIYDAAEKLLKAGYDFQSVADKTRLPLEDVRMLSQIVVDTPESDPEIVRPPAKPPYAAQDEEEYLRKSPVFDPQEVETRRGDERLGVLGTMRREKYTV